MFFQSKKKKAQLKAEFDYLKQLHSIPVRNSKAETVDEGEDFLEVAVPLEYTGLAKKAAQFLNARTKKKYRLEGLSYQLYRALDGKKTVENLIDSLIERYQLTFFESRALVIQYLHTLIRRGLVAVAVKDESGD